MASKQVQRIENELTGAVEKVVGKLQLRVLQGLQAGSPVDTGHARSGWFPATGTPVTNRLDRPVDRAEAEDAAARRARRNLARATEILRSYRLRLGRVFITNPVPYIISLNEGSSSQAGARWVDKVIALAVKSFGGKQIS